MPAYLKIIPFAFCLLLLSHCEKKEEFASVDNSAERAAFYERHNVSSLNNAKEKIAKKSSKETS